MKFVSKHGKGLPPKLERGNPESILPSRNYL